MEEKYISRYEVWAFRALGAVSIIWAVIEITLILNGTLDSVWEWEKFTGIR